MSQVYSLEPPTLGKVILHTSLGDVEIELWTKEAPKACRNFLQLCLEGYYIGTTFHRVVKGFIVQGGKGLPEKIAAAGGDETIYGQNFADEIHSRLKFNRRGLVGCANKGTPDSNTSEFFVTLDKAPELTGTHTMFGRVAGGTLFNVLKMGELELDPLYEETPLFPVTIKSTQVILQPFDDLIPRDLKISSPAAIAVVPPQVKNKKGKRIAPGLLSFVDQEELDVGIPDSDAFVAKIKSRHDVVEDDPLLLTHGPQDESPSPKETFSESPPAEICYETSSLARDSAPHQEVKPNALASASDCSQPALNTTLCSEKEKQTVESGVRDQIHSITEELKKGKVQQIQDCAAKGERKKRANPSFLEEERQKFVSSKKVILGGRALRKDGTTDLKMLKLLDRFQSRISDAKSDLEQERELMAKPIQVSRDETLCPLHHLRRCQTCHPEPEEKPSSDVTFEDKVGWMAHRFICDDDKDRLGKRMIEDASTLVVIDPREKTQQIMEERKEKRKSKKMR